MCVITDALLDELLKTYSQPGNLLGADSGSSSNPREQFNPSGVRQTDGSATTYSDEHQGTSRFARGPYGRNKFRGPLGDLMNALEQDDPTTAWGGTRPATCSPGEGAD